MIGLWIVGMGVTAFLSFLDLFVDLPVTVDTRETDLFFACDGVNPNAVPFWFHFVCVRFYFFEALVRDIGVELKS